MNRRATLAGLMLLAAGASFGCESTPRPSTGTSHSADNGTTSPATTISVGDFGAYPDDGLDDRAAIQAAMNAMAPGDQLIFSQGEYDVDLNADGRPLWLRGLS